MEWQTGENADEHFKEHTTFRRRWPRSARQAGVECPSDALAVRQALEEAIANREVEATLKALIRRGRHHFVDLESAGK